MENNINRQDTIGVAASVISIEKGNNNGRRGSIIIINASTGGQKITICIDGESVAGFGIPLAPGGSWMDSEDSGYKPTQKYISAISDIAGGLLSIQERVIY